MPAASPRPAPVVRLNRNDRRRQLLDCAVTVFARDGLGRAGHTQVAELAGVSVPTVFKYFATREALVEAVLGRVERVFLALAKRCHQGERPAREALHEHAQGFIEVAHEQPDLTKIWLEWSGSLRADVWPRFLKLEKKLTKIVAGSIEGDSETRDGITGVEAALALNGIAHVLIHMIFAPKGLLGDPEAFSVHVVDALLGLKAAQ